VPTRGPTNFGGAAPRAHVRRCGKQVTEMSFSVPGSTSINWRITPRDLQQASIVEWQRHVRCEDSWPAGTSFPELDEFAARVSGWAERCSELQSLMGVDQDWPSGTSFAEVEAA
jgi:hypothetical protein